ncbi:MAG: ABC transporter substrate-binding protein [Chloroflexi bacterium]|nr:ABC transporter substrate-binding protein [Chloroflexota bacterium]
MTHTPARKLWSALALITAFALVLTACGGAATPAPKPTIKLAENAWTGSSVNVHVAKILLEKLGYPVEIVTIDENAQWASLAKGDLSASLELWPSGHAENIKQYIDEQKVVENAGPLGVVGKIGWYIPTYMVDQNPELATWEGLKQDAAMFKTAETGDAGQFLAGDPSWVQYDGDVIKNLDMNFKVVSVGSEQAVLAAVDAAYSRNDPVLFYFWTPHSVHAKYELTEVKLPDYSDACYAKASAGGVDCDYPPDVLFKIVWGDLKTKTPEAYQLLKNFKYTNADQIGMIAAVEVNGKTVDAAAQEWVDKNEATWKAWMPTN